MSLQQSAFRIRLPCHLEREHIGAMYRAFVEQTQSEGGQYFMVTPEISVDLVSLNISCMYRTSKLIHLRNSLPEHLSS